MFSLEVVTLVSFTYYSIIFGSSWKRGALWWINYVWSHLIQSEVAAAFHLINNTTYYYYYYYYIILSKYLLHERFIVIHCHSLLLVGQLCVKTCLHIYKEKNRKKDINAEPRYTQFSHTCSYVHLFYCTWVAFSVLHIFLYYTEVIFVCYYATWGAVALRASFSDILLCQYYMCFTIRPDTDVCTLRALIHHRASCFCFMFL